MPWRPQSVCRCQKQEADSSVTCQEFHTHHKTAHAIISPGKWGSWRVSCHSYELSLIMFIKLFYETFYWEQNSHGVVNQNLSDDLCIHKVPVGYAVLQHTGWFFKQWLCERMLLFRLSNPGEDRPLSSVVTTCSVWAEMRGSLSSHIHNFTPLWRLVLKYRCEYTHIHTDTHTEADAHTQRCIHTNTRASTHICTHVHTHIYTEMHTHACTHIHSSTHIHACIHTHVHMHADTPTETHTHIRTHIYTYFKVWM